MREPLKYFSQDKNPVNQDSNPRPKVPLSEEIDLEDASMVQTSSSPQESKKIKKSSIIDFTAAALRSIEKKLNP